MKLQNVGITLAFALLVVVVRAGYVVEPPHAEQAFTLTVAKEIVQGKALYTDIWAPGSPALYYLYALGYYITGGRLWCFSFLEILNIIVAGLLLYRLLVVNLDRTVAVFALCSYALVFNHVLCGGWYARAVAEVFCEIPILSILLFGHYIHKWEGRKLNLGFLGQGVLGGILLMIQVSAWPFLLCAFADYWCLRRKEHWRRLGRHLVLFASGFFCVAGLVTAAFLWQGNGAAFYQAVFGTSALGPYDTAAHLSACEKLIQCFANFVYLAPVAVLAAYGYGRYCRWPNLSLSWLCWPWAAVVYVLWQDQYLTYQCLPLLTSCLVMASLGAVLLLRTIPFLSRSVWKFAGAALLLGAITYLLVAVECFSYYRQHRTFDYLAGKISQEALLRTYAAPAEAFHTLPSWKAGQYLKSVAKSGDRLFVFGQNTLPYLYANLPCATQYACIPYVPNLDAHRLILNELSRTFLQQPPEYMLMSQGVENFQSFVHRNRREQLTGLKFYTLLMTQYRLAKYYPPMLVYKRVFQQK